MKSLFSIVRIASLVALTACSGGGATAPTPIYNDISGSYSGPVIGLTQGIALAGTFGVTITQTGANTGGSWALQGTLNGGGSNLSVQGTGTLSGTVAAGNNPSVTVIIRTPLCPNYQANFSGAYDTTNRRLTLTGPVEFFANNSCNVALSYQGTFVLNR